jgi:hypothetical protein
LTTYFVPFVDPLRFDAKAREARARPENFLIELWGFAPYCKDFSRPALKIKTPARGNKLPAGVTLFSAAFPVSSGDVVTISPAEAEA